VLIAYDSRTGNVRKFVERTALPSVRIEDDLTIDEPFVLVTYTTGFGNVPDKVVRFLQRNGRLLRGVAASGNRNWGPLFAGSADRISFMYRVPVIGKFELSGTEEDRERFLKGVETIAAHRVESYADAAR
jgi:protein involved in ribonucleotide reduction